MVNEISLKKAQDFKRKSMLTGLRFMQEKVAVGKLAESYNNTNNYSKVNEDKNNGRQS
ncbi:MAG: hypothetical protein IJ019_06735 [Alphaproteobacteria bacterium]|nr:hypothetical protein [Alphaproteobacteria bacterium]